MYFEGSRFIALQCKKYELKAIVIGLYIPITCTVKMSNSVLHPKQTGCKIHNYYIFQNNDYKKPSENRFLKYKINTSPFPFR